MVLNWVSCTKCILTNVPQSILHSWLYYYVIIHNIVNILAIDLCYQLQLPRVCIYIMNYNLFVYESHGSMHATGVWCCVAALGLQYVLMFVHGNYVWQYKSAKSNPCTCNNPTYSNFYTHISNLQYTVFEAPTNIITMISCSYLHT